ncbi:WG repeat-containing protein [Chitinophaga lutea]
MKKVLLLLIWTAVCMFDASAQLQEVWVPYRKGGKWGFCTKSREMTIEPRFDDARQFGEAPPKQEIWVCNSYAWVKYQGKECWVSRDGNVFPMGANVSVAPRIVGGKETPAPGKPKAYKREGFDGGKDAYAAPKQFGLAVKKANGKMGILRDQELVVPVQYDSVWFPPNAEMPVAFVRVAGKCGVVSTLAGADGSVFVEPAYDAIRQVPGRKWFYFVTQKGKQGLTSIMGEVIPPVYKKVTPIGDASCELTCFTAEDEKGMVMFHKSYQGTPRTGYYQEIGHSGNGYRRGFFSYTNVTAVRKDNKWGFIDWTGEVMVDCKYDMVEDFSAAGEGFTRVVLNGKAGYINEKGEEYFEN